MTAHASGGAPPQPFDAASLPQRSTIQPDPLDYHEWEFEVCREKLSDWAWVQQQIAAGNSQGIANLHAHAMEHQRYIAQAQAAQAAQMAAAQPATAAPGHAKQTEPPKQQPAAPAMPQ
jgi:hypothetical protein